MVGKHEAESINRDDCLLRFVHQNMVSSKTSQPSTKEFETKKGDKGISVNLERLASPEQSYVILSLQKKFNRKLSRLEFKDPKKYLLYRLPCAAITANLGNQAKFRYDPVKETDDQPANPAHCLIITDIPTPEEVRLELHKIAKDNLCKVDIVALMDEIEQQRETLS